ncbi:hypothetical protein [Streptacidiphilus sp. EB129]|uniref:hypothetical protein n=1 Tax=Streptacidiphilus sp. EB129 TaxID=3156262 RepID=UPI0035133FF9
MTTATTRPDVEVEFQLPPDFREILAGASPEQARAAVVERFGPDAVAALPALVLEAAVAEYLTASHWLEEAGVFHASACLGLIDGAPTLSSLTLARVNADAGSPVFGDPETTVAGIIETMGRGPGGATRDARRYDLPCGPAAVVVESAVGLVLPAADVGTESDLPVPVATLQAYVPFPAEVAPDQDALLVVTFSTPSIQHWEVYCPMVADLLRSLRFPAAAAPRVRPSTIRNALG